MGQKVHPTGLRIGITEKWNSQWYAGKGNYKKLFHDDIKLEKFIRERIENDGLSKIEILRTQGKVIINIYTSKPGLIIGRGGETIEKLKEDLTKAFNENFAINIKEVKKPMLDASIVAENIARQVEKKISYRRACKMSVDRSMETGAEGIRIGIKGRLNGVEIARSETFSKGKVPLHTLRADIDYASTTASTTYGKIGIKVWIYKGEVFKQDLDAKLAQQIEESNQM